MSDEDVSDELTEAEEREIARIQALSPDELRAELMTVLGCDSDALDAFIAKGKANFERKLIQSDFAHGRIDLLRRRVIVSDKSK